MAFRFTTLGVVLAACFALTASASPIVLGIQGDAEISSSAISFGDYPNGTPYTPAPGYGTFMVSPSYAGPFSDAGVVAGEYGHIQSLSSSTTPVGVNLSPTPGSSLPFMTFDTGGSNLQMYLTELVAGTQGPFTLTDTTNGAVASFDIDGFLYDTNTQTERNFTGTFSATFNGMTVAELEAASSTTTPFSGTFTLDVAAPEPSTVTLLGGALAGFGLLAIRRKRAIQN